jgi:hypothetical protein
MRLFCPACEVLARPLYLAAARSPHIVDISLLRRGLHNNPADLRARLQTEINHASEAYDAIVMGYGLCGMATSGLVAPGIPVIIPRAHDCITLFLGSRARYNQQFEQFPGTYWYALDYVERDDGDGGSLALGSAGGSDIDQTYATYLEKYGKENADYLMEVMGTWQQHYRRAVLIDLGVGDISATAARAEADSERRGWTLDRIAGDMTLIRRLLEGDWDDDFLILQPGEAVRMTYDAAVIGCAASGAAP